MSNDKSLPAGRQAGNDRTGGDVAGNQSAPMDSHHSIIKSGSIIAGGTLSSRILGFIRDIILARILGTGLKADAFFVATKIPNLFRDLVGEGATNSSVVPVLSEYRVKKTPEEFWNFVSVILVMAMVALSVITLLGMIFVDPIVRLIAPGFIATPEKFELTVKLTRLVFPYLILIGLTAYSMAILYTFKSFRAPAYSPCLLNIAMIIGALISVKFMEEPVYGLAISVIAGGVLQLLAQQAALLKTGIRFKWPRTFKHAGALQVGKLFVPRLFGAGVYQASVLLDTFCASLASIVGPGGVSAIYYANRIIQLPMGVFGVALASAALPTLSDMVSNNDTEKFKKAVVFSLENIFFIMFPTSIIIMLLGMPVIRVLFERGEFDEYSTAITGGALMCYSLGLFSFGAIKIMVAAFHAMQDTRTPVKVAALCLMINAALNFLLMIPFKVSGIALASSTAATIDFLILFHLLDKRLGGLNSGLRLFIGKVLFATLVTGLGVYLGWTFVPMPEALKLFVVGTAGFMIYGLLCVWLKVEPAQKLSEWMFRLWTLRKK